MARSGVYRQPRPADKDDLALMRRIDELFTDWPFLGARRLAEMLRAEGTAGEPQARAAADAPDGDCGAGAEAAHSAEFAATGVAAALVQPFHALLNGKVKCAATGTKRVASAARFVTDAGPRLPAGWQERATCRTGSEES